MSDLDFELNTVKVILKGLMVLFTKDPTKCVIGLLREAPANHNTRIEVLERVSAAGQFTRVDPVFENQGAHGKFDLWLEDQNPGVTRRDALLPIDRDKVERLDSFNWLLDFERDYLDHLPTRPIGCQGDKLVSLITVHHGEIFTKEISVNSLQFRPAGDTHWSHLGKVAVEIGIKLVFRPGKGAIFKKTGGPTMALTNGKEYQVHIQRAEPRPGDATGHDVDFYLGAFGKPVLPPLSHRSIPQRGSAGPSTPDATCPIGGMGESGPPS